MYKNKPHISKPLQNATIITHLDITQLIFKRISPEEIIARDERRFGVILGVFDDGDCT